MTQELPDTFVFTVMLSTTQLLKRQRGGTDNALWRGKATKREASNGGLLGGQLGKANSTQVEEAGLRFGLDAKVSDHIRNGGTVKRARGGSRGSSRGTGLHGSGFDRR